MNSFGESETINWVTSFISGLKGWLRGDIGSSGAAAASLEEGKLNGRSVRSSPSSVLEISRLPIPNSNGKQTLGHRSVEMSSDGASVASAVASRVWPNHVSDIASLNVPSKSVLLHFFPFQDLYKDGPTKLLFKWDLETCKVRIEISCSDGLMRLDIERIGTIETNDRGELTYEFQPISESTKINILMFNDHKNTWMLRSELNCISGKFRKFDAIPKVRRPEIESLAMAPLSVNLIPKIAKSWKEQGSYICEGDGIIYHDIYDDRGPLVQDLKVVAFLAAGITTDEIVSHKDEVAKRISEKTANLNCWQFCLLVYIQAGLLSAETIGHLYIQLERLNKHTNPQERELRIPDAIKCGNAYAIDLTRPETTPKRGDFIFFRRDRNLDWHCAIVVKSKTDSNRIVVVQMQNGPAMQVTIPVPNKHHHLTFVKAEEVQGNILNFLEYFNYTPGKHTEGD